MANPSGSKGHICIFDSVKEYGERDKNGKTEEQRIAAVRAFIVLSP